MKIDINITSIIFKNFCWGKGSNWKFKDLLKSKRWIFPFKHRNYVDESWIISTYFKEKFVLSKDFTESKLGC